MTVIHLGDQFYQGLSSDTKPTDVPDNSTFYETDTFTHFKRVSSAWKEVSQRASSADYIVYISGSSYKAMNTSTKAVDYSTTTLDIGAFTNTVLGGLTNGGMIEYARGLYTTNTPIAVPKAAVNSLKPYTFRGAIYSNQRDVATQFKVGSTFPDQRYMFESVSAGGSGTTSQFVIERLIAVNSTYAKSGSSGGTLNISGTSTLIDAGLVKFESDTNGGFGSPIIVRDVWTQYLWRGIHLIGWIYSPIIHNCVFFDNNIHYIGDFDIQFEFGSGHAERVKVADVRNIRCNHISGLLDSGGLGSVNAACNFSGGYHYIDNIFVDGSKYNDCVIGFKQLFSTTVNRIQTIDMVPTAQQGGSFQAVYLFDTTDPGGVVATSTYTTFNNQIYDIAGSPVPNTIKFANSPFRNYIRAYAYWGSPIVVSDAGAGIENVLELIDGQQPSATTQTKLTTSNSLIKIIDKRVGAENKGLETQSGNASDTAFNIAHGCYTTPTNFYAVPLTPAAMADATITATSTNIVVTFSAAPANASNNLKWSWYASVY